MTDPCVVAADAVAAATQWSQALYQLQRWMWHNGCTQVAKPDPAQGWANDFIGFPPESFTYPGNPNDRQPGQG
jgi:hypothetical protein